MKKGIKLMTIAALIAVFLLQLFWLTHMYWLNKDSYRKVVDQCLKEAASRELALRKQALGGEMHIAFKRDTNDSTRHTPPRLQTGDQTITINYDKDDPNMLPKIEQYAMHQIQPVNVRQLDSIFRRLLLGQGYRVTTTCVELLDLQANCVISCSQPMRPSSGVQESDVLPIDINQSLGVKAYSDNSFLVMVNRMFAQLALSIVLMAFAVAGMFFQWRTIFRQWKEEEIRRRSVNAMLHEFKRPIITLRTILSNMEVAIKKTPDWMEKYTEMSRFQIDKLVQYIEKIRDISKKRRGTMDLNMEKVELEPIFEELKNRYEQYDGKKVVVDIPANNGYQLYIDKLHFSNIMDNLVENSIKYSDEAVHILVSVTENSRSLFISVRDDGWGIAHEELPHIFDDFFRGQSKNKRNKDGLGLGLCYVDMMTKAMGGSIHVDSKEGEYSEFTLEFPKAMIE